MRPAEDGGETDCDGDDGTQRENDRAQRPPRAVDDEHDHHQEDSEQGHEALRGHACLLFEPFFQPGSADAADSCERSFVCKRQYQGIDRCQSAIALGSGAHAQLERDSEVVVAEESGAAQQGCPRSERANGAGIDRFAGTRPAIKGEEAVRLDVWNLCQVALEPARGVQRRGAQRIRRFEHEQCLIAFRIDLLEIGRSLGQRIPADGQAVDGGIVGDLQGAVDSGGRQDREGGDDACAKSQQTQEDPEHLGRGGHTHFFHALRKQTA